MMSNYSEIIVETSGEDLVNITPLIKDQLDKESAENGVVHLYLTHTSCGLCISEAHDDTARQDLRDFLKHLAPRNLSFIRHTAEGPDDSPSHMKSALLHQSLTFFVDNGEIVLGQWQGIYLAEFRDDHHRRKVLFKYIAD